MRRRKLERLGARFREFKESVNMKVSANAWFRHSHLIAGRPPPLSANICTSGSREMHHRWIHIDHHRGGYGNSKYWNSTFGIMSFLSE